MCVPSESPISGIEQLPAARPQVARSVPFSLRTIEPVGVPAALVTDAVKVTSEPVIDGFTLLVSVVVVGASEICWLRVPDALPVWFASPPKVAEIGRAHV